MISFFILIVNQVAVHCTVGIDVFACSEISYRLTAILLGTGALEVAYELRGFIRILKERNRGDDDDSNINGEDTRD